MARYVLALDQGTTSSRAILFDRGGRIVSAAQQEFPQLFPAPGHVEHNPEAIWQSQLRTARAAIRRAKARACEIAAIGITNQRETVILWERATGRPVHNAMVWQSRISAPICDSLKRRGLEKLFRRKTGLLLDPYFSGTKIKYLLDRIPGLRRRALRGEILAGTVDSFLLWRLTGGRVHATDASNASRTLLFNIHALDWDEELLRILGIPRAMLSELCDSSGVIGETDSRWFGAPIPIAGIAGDQQAALFGQCCFVPGMAKNTYGTGCFLLLNTGSRPVTSRSGLLTTVGWRIGGRTTYCLEGSIFIAGAAVQWLRDALRVIRYSSDVQTLADSVPSSAGVYFVPAFVGLGAPHWDPYARGAIFGLERGTTAAHLARATLEAMAFQTRDVLHAMQQDTGRRLRRLRVDGGAAVNSLLLQFQADILGCPVERPVVTETTALGAAYLAGLGVGFWKNLGELTRHWDLDAAFRPRMSASRRRALCRGWHEAARRTRGWAAPAAGG